MIATRVGRGGVVRSRDLVRRAVAVSPRVQECLVDIARTIRADRRCPQGVSTRSLVQAIPALQTLAMLRGREFVSPDDVEYLAVPLFQHRLALVPGVEDPRALVAESVRGPIEALSRATLQR